MTHGPGDRPTPSRPSPRRRGAAASASSACPVRSSATIAHEILGELPEPRRAALRIFRDADGEMLDGGLALYFPAPASFTGEDVLELHGHGGPVVMDMLLARVLELGARIAQPGEFSRAPSSTTSST